VSTSKGPQIDDVQYPRIPSRILKRASHEEVVNDEGRGLKLRCPELFDDEAK
jgi:hypothetical protein